MIRYEIVKRTAEISWKNRKEIKEGCTYDVLCEDGHTDYPELIASFNSEEEARKEFENYKTHIYKYSGVVGPFYWVEEYCIEENEYDEDDDMITIGICEFSEMKITVMNDMNEVAVCSSFEEAEEIYNNYGAEGSMWISFD